MSCSLCSFTGSFIFSLFLTFRLKILSSLRAGSLANSLYVFPNWFSLFLPSTYEIPLIVSVSFYLTGGFLPSMLLMVLQTCDWFCWHIYFSPHILSNFHVSFLYHSCNFRTCFYFYQFIPILTNTFSQAIPHLDCLLDFGCHPQLRLVAKLIHRNMLFCWLRDYFPQFLFKFVDILFSVLSRDIVLYFLCEFISIRIFQLPFEYMFAVYFRNHVFILICYDNRFKIWTKVIIYSPIELVH